MFTFAIGIVTQQWQLAIIGIVYSYMTAAAMWQNFRARLPYLYDPWSEQLPLAPTLMHAMISISVLVEVAALLSVALLWALGQKNRAAAQASAYALSAIIVWYFVSNFLEKRGVFWQDIWHWPHHGDSKTSSALITGAGVGVVLGICAHGYLAVLRLFPAAAELIRTSEQQWRPFQTFISATPSWPSARRRFPKNTSFADYCFAPSIANGAAAGAPSPVAPCSSRCTIPFSLGFPSRSSAQPTLCYLNKQEGSPAR